ncbi:MAG: MBL fold metallo-hydrolase [Gemmatimonadaceae bacterium]
MSAVIQLADDLHFIDLDFQGTPGTIGVYLLSGGDRLTLIETGPGSTLDALLAGVQAAGFDPARIGHLVVTHIHLDHAGAAGALLRYVPTARLLVSEFGIQHVVDPTKLVASATRIYGDAMERLWGEIVPVPAARADALRDGAELALSGRELHCVYTPGHASHHLAFYDPRRAVVFTGDVAGVRLGGARYVCPPTPPPDVDLELWRASVLRLREFRAEALYLTHFGEVRDVDWHLDDLLARLHLWAGWTRGRIATEADTHVLAAELRAMQAADIAAALGAADPRLAANLELATPSQMSVDGLARYFTLRAKGRAGR